MRLANKRNMHLCFTFFNLFNVLLIFLANALAYDAGLIISNPIPTEGGS